jgi:O-antigen ligase
MNRLLQDLRRVAVALLGVALGTLFGIALGVAWGGGGALLYAVALAVLTMFVVSWRPLLGVLLVPASVGLGNDPIPGAPLGLQPGQVLVGVAVAGVVLHFLLYMDDRLTRPSGPTVRCLLAMGAYVAACWFSGLVGDTPLASLMANITLSIAALFAAAICVTVQTVGQLRVFVVVVLLGALGAMLPVFGQMGEVRSQLGGTVVDNRPSGAFPDPNELGVFAALVLMLALALVAVGNRIEVVVGCTVAAVAAVALVLSFSRGAWVASLVGLAVLLSYAGTRRRVAKTLAAGAVLAAGITLSGLVSLPTQAIQDRVTSLVGGQANPYDARPDIWAEAVTVFLENPLLGAGPASFPAVAEEAPRFIWAYPVVHAHNWVLTTAAEVGLVGLGTAAIVVAVVGGALVGAWRTAAGRDPRLAGLLCGLAAALCAVAGSQVIDYSLRNPTLLVMLWTLLGLAVAASRIAAEEAGPAVRPARPTGTGVGS